MGKVISLGIQKGGCGKTTTCGMLAFIFASKGYKVLAVDFDSQGNLTQFISGRNPYDFQDKTILQACKERDPKPYIVEVSENLHLLPAEDFLSKFANYVLVEYVKEASSKGIRLQQFAPSLVLKETLDTIKDEYDFILLDLPPNLGEQTINGMVASDYAMVMLQSEPFCKSSLERYLETLEGAIEKVNNETRLLGILTSMIDARVSLAQHILNETRDEYGELVFDTIIKRRSRIMEYAFQGYSYTNREDRDAQAMYMELADEMLKRMGIA